MEKYSLNNVKAILNEFKLTLLSDFKGVDYHMECVDENGFKYSMTLYNLKNRKSKNIYSGAYNNKNIFKEYNINHYINKYSTNGTKIVYTPSCIEKEEITFNCGICGNNFFQLWKIFVRNNPNHCCQKCSHNLKKNKKKDYEYISNIFKKANYKMIDTDNKGIHHAYYIEDKNGFRGRMLPYTAQKKKSKIEKFNIHNKYSIDNINLYLKNMNINLICLENGFYSEDKSLKFKCSCGNIFYSIWSNVLSGKTRCNICSNSISNNENKVKEYMDYLKIKYKMQYRIKTESYINNLYFDFYLLDYNVFIEVDGEQHYRPVRFGGISNNQAEHNFKEQNIRDSIKNDYCKTNKINLIRISYEDIKNDNYKQIINKLSIKE